MNNSLIYLMLLKLLRDKNKKLSGDKVNYDHPIIRDNKTLNEKISLGILHNMDMKYIKFLEPYDTVWEFLHNLMKLDITISDEYKTKDYILFYVVMSILSRMSDNEQMSLAKDYFEYIVGSKSSLCLPTSDAIIDPKVLKYIISLNSSEKKWF